MLRSHQPWSSARITKKFGGLGESAAMASEFSASAMVSAAKPAEQPRLGRRIMTQFSSKIAGNTRPLSLHAPTASNFLLPQQGALIDEGACCVEGLSLR